MSIAAGHPDWQNYASWRGPPILSTTALPLGGGGYLGPITPIPHFSALTVRISATNRNISLFIRFYGDAGGVNQVQVVGFTIPVGAQLSANIPALGPYCQIVMNNYGAAGGSVNIFVQPSNIAAPRPQYIAQGAGIPLAWGSALTPASGNLTVTTGEVYGGLCCLFAGTSSGSAYHGTVGWFDPVSLAYQQISAFSGSIDGQRATRLFAAPPSTLQLSGSNDDTVARTLTFVLTSAGG